MDVYINGVSYYLPTQLLTNEAIAEQHPEWDAEKILQKIGIQNRHVAADDEFVSDMAIKAANKLFTEYVIDRNDIDFLILCTQTPDYQLPATASIIQAELGLRTSTGAFDVNLGCSGYVYGLAMAKSLVVSNMAKNVLLITSEAYSKLINPEDKSLKSIFGDAASATLISAKAETGLWKLEEFIFGTDGSGVKNLLVKNGGTRYKNEVGENEYDEKNSFFKNDSNIYMNGRSIFTFTTRIIPDLVADVLKKNGKTKDDVDAYVMHQANKHILEFLRKQMNVEASKLKYSMENTGNTVSNTIPIVLKETCMTLEDKNLLMLGFGVGYSWAGCMLTANS
jgi:3-oxoacyl-[acyl-carrier-protein] synthase III